VVALPDFFTRESSLKDHFFDQDHFLFEVPKISKISELLILTTSIFVFIYNRLALLLGCQSFPTCMSLQYSIGCMIKIKTVSCILLSVDHIRMPALKKLLKLLKTHGFKIIGLFSSTFGLCFIKNKGKSIGKIIFRFSPLGHRAITCSWKRNKVPARSYRLNMQKLHPWIYCFMVLTPLLERLEQC